MKLLTYIVWKKIF